MDLKNRLNQDVDLKVSEEIKEIERKRIPEEKDIDQVKEKMTVEKVMPYQQGKISNDLLLKGKKNRNRKRPHQRTFFVFSVTLLFFITILYLVFEYMLKG